MSLSSNRKSSIVVSCLLSVLIDDVYQYTGLTGAFPLKFAEPKHCRDMEKLNFVLNALKCTLHAERHLYEYFARLGPCLNLRCGVLGCHIGCHMGCRIGCSDTNKKTNYRIHQ